MAGHFQCLIVASMSSGKKIRAMLLRLEILSVISRLNGHGHMVTECSAAW
ncbi:hypothetical protein BMNI_I0193 [Brucella melitensis NI]|nr:hypothetical protein BMNI_I0193 [Brucella melitensis NI]